MRALAAVLLVLAGCSSGTPFTARVTLRLDGTVDEATVERVRRFQVVASGDEMLTDSIAVTRGAREQRFVYTALRSTRHLTLAVTAFDENDSPLAYGEDDLTLDGGGAISTTLTLYPPGSVDFARLEDMGRPDDLAGRDLAGRDLLEDHDMAAEPGDMAMAVDMAPFCDPAGTQNSCNGTMLRRCLNDGTAFEDIPCDATCSTTGGAHCVDLDPSGVLAPADVRTGATADVVISADAVFDTDSGFISGGLVRTGGIGLSAGISFQQVAQPGAAKDIGVFGFKTLTITGGATIRAVGVRAFAIVATGNVVVNGRIEMQACGGNPAAGGFAGGRSGPGGGTGGQTGTGFDGGVAGAGGGGNGALGGAGGWAAPHTNGASGVALADIATDTFFLVGGGGGGGGQGPADAGAGGNGGGAVQIATLGTLTVNGVIHAGGCGASIGLSSYGSGGGAGGTIVLEASAVTLGVGSVIASNGGGGSCALGGAPFTSGASATATNSVPASSGTPCSPAGTYGFGGIAGTPEGRAGYNNTSGGFNGQGGGGAAGRIAVKSASGTITDSGAVWSPALNDMNGASVKVALVGQAKFQ